MTRLQARTRVRTHINEVDTQTKWTDIELNDYIGQAADDVHRRVARVAPEQLSSTISTWTWPADTEYQDITGTNKLTVAGSDFVRVLKVKFSTASGTFGSSNVPTTIPFVGVDELPTLYGGGTYYTGASYHCAISGVNLYIAPYATTTLYLQIQWIAPLVAMTADSDNLLGGKLPNTHKIICIKAALMALTKTREKNAQLDAEEEKAEAEFEDEFSSDRTSGPTFMSDPYGATWRQ